MSVLEAAESGDRRAVLEALKLRLAAAVDGAADRDLAALSRRMVAVVAELADGDEAGGSIDDLAARRARRRPDAAAQ